ncbi:MAG: DUF2071 domain-containing protein [Planctomycetota bacterium]|nr:DUF2071 domain-containing protein [Planctomycetota bacterium]
MNYAETLERRIQSRHVGWLDIRSTLQHFALINYAVPIDRLTRHIPREHFEVVPFEVDGQTCGLLSVVPFLDEDFHYPRLVPFAKFRFGQTNHRVYVTHRRSGEHAVWFFGTTLGSWLVHCARLLWRIPWHRAKYDIDCVLDESTGRYRRFAMQVDSSWCPSEIELQHTGEPMPLLEGFTSMPQQQLVLTHPVDGYFRRLDGSLGTYSIWHEEIALTQARAKRLYFGLYEQLGILSREEMMRPHSVLICPKTEFVVHMPPRRYVDAATRPGAAPS